MEYFAGNEYLSSPKEYVNAGSGGSSNRFSMGSFGADCCSLNEPIGTFNSGTLSSSTSSSQQYDPPNQPNRETGIIEKLLVCNNNIIFTIYISFILKIFLAFVWIHTMLRTAGSSFLSLFSIQWKH